MDNKRFLLELGCEELPDKQLEIAIGAVEKEFVKFSQENKLHYASYQVSGTPRRIYLDVKALAIRQEDEILEKTGPSVNIAFSPDGKLSPAGAGFLKKCGVDEADSRIIETEKGKFIAVRQERKGEETSALIQAWVPQLIDQIPFGKKMIWSDTSLAFSRPLRWMIALWDTEALKLDFYGIPCGKVSYANRYLGLDKAIEITSPEVYASALLAGRVMVSTTERIAVIRAQLNSIFKEQDSSGGQSPDCHEPIRRLVPQLTVIEDERLIETVANLVEYPTAVAAQFEEKYLALPEKIIISTISQNQKYFSVKDSSGKLSNTFVFVSNGDPAFSELIKKGNQKVVNARLADALWYFNEDTAHPLESFVPRLKDVVFQAKLGTLADKTQRIMQLAEHLSRELRLDTANSQKLKRCALLCKADLVTTMLGEKEFTKLQGYIGKQYALASQEDPEVAEGIYEHYMPRGSADSLPGTMCGKITAIADKMDTVCGIIGIGMLPTGSGDPFALRRAANGIVQIISDSAWDIDLYALADYALELLAKQADLTDNAKRDLHAFLDQRVEGLLKQQGIAYDVIDSVMHIEKSRIHDLENRARDLHNLKSQLWQAGDSQIDSDFVKLIIGFKRVSNIIAETKDFAVFNPQMLKEPAEQQLYSSLQNLQSAIDLALSGKDYTQALHHLIGYGAAIDSFFDDVLVNCEDAILRSNRHALLLEIRKQFLRVADLSLIVLETTASGE